MPSAAFQSARNCERELEKPEKILENLSALNYHLHVVFFLPRHMQRRSSSGEKGSILVVVAQRKRIAIKTENCLLFFVLLLLHSCAIQSCCSEPQQENMKAPFKTLMALMEERMKNSFCISSRLAERMNFHDILLLCIAISYGQCAEEMKY